MSKPTTDADLSRFPQWDVYAEWLADRAAICELLDALPRCDYYDCDTRNLCGALAFNEGIDNGYYCDKHAPRWAISETPYACALRTMIARREGWGK